MSEATTSPWLTSSYFLPLAGAAAVFRARSRPAGSRLGVTIADLVIGLPLWWSFDPIGSSHMQFAEHVAWIQVPPITYSVGLDGISLPLFLMTTFLTPFCVLASWSAITSRVQGFMAMLLVMETAMLGVFAALDFVLFYIFWEAMLIPMYLLIGMWGGANRLYAAIKFFLYTLAGSMLLLVAILVLYFNGGHTFDILALSRGTYSASLQTSSSGPSLPPSPSRSPCSLCTPGCRMRTWRHRPPAASSWPVSFLKWERMDFSDLRFPCCPMPRSHFPDS